MSIKEIIQKALDGKWREEDNITHFVIHESGFVSLYDSESGKYPDLSLADIVIQPDFWKAVGKSLGWKEEKFYPYDPVHATGEVMPEAKWYMLGMIQALWVGKTPEDYIKTL